MDYSTFLNKTITVSNFFKSLYCIIFGHKMVDEIREYDDLVTFKHCKRCSLSKYSHIKFKHKKSPAKYLWSDEEWEKYNKEEIEKLKKDFILENLL